MAGAASQKPRPQTRCIEERYLVASLEMLRKQREALVDMDVATVNSCFEKLAELLTGLRAELEPDGQVSPSYRPEQVSEILKMARAVREEIRVNRFLLGSGLLAADHMVRTMAPPANSGKPFRLSGVA